MSFLKHVYLKATFLVAMTVFFISCKKNEGNVSSVTGKDLQFVRSALIANQAEIELGQVASNRAAAHGVKAFGDMMANEHTETHADLQQINANEQLSLSSTIDAKHQQIKTKLNSVSGYTFDTLYIRGQVRDHQTTAALYQSEIDSGKNTIVRNHALKFLPHIKMHLAKADSLLNTLTP
jgi:putative membrane protein